MYVQIDSLDIKKMRSTSRHTLEMFSDYKYNFKFLENITDEKYIS